jgi:hypothetical protein
MFVRKRNPLWRRSDRIEIVMLVGLFASFLLGAPVLAWWTAGLSYRSDQQAIAWERDNLHEVDAVLDRPAADQPSTPYTAQASWRAPNGTPRTGPIAVASGEQPGDTIRIWVNNQGDVRSKPGGRNPVGKAGLVAVVVIASVAAGTNALRRLGVALLDRHRARSWQRAWRDVGPRWSRDLLP